MTFVPVLNYNTPMKQSIAKEDVEHIADALADKGYCILDKILEPSLVDALAERVYTLEGFKQASIGRAEAQHQDRSIRSDKSLWLEGAASSEADYLAWMESLRTGINRELFLGLFDYEAHFAHYAKGDFYKKHSDVLRGSNNRMLTTVFYLSSDWQEGDGGELLIYDEEGSEILEKVAPKKGVMVIFLSEKFPHEVLPSGKDRFSIAGWFRVNASSSRQIDTMF